MRCRMIQCLMDSVDCDEAMTDRIGAFVDPLTANVKKVTLMLLSQVPLVANEDSISREDWNQLVVEARRVSAHHCLARSTDTF